MMKSEEEARQACVEMVDHLIDYQKKNISQLEFMKEHINDMSTEQFERFGSVFAFAMAVEMLEKTMKLHSAIRATNATIEHIKEDE